MKKRILPILLAFIVCLAAVRPFGVCAATLDPAAKASLTLYYQKEGTVFPDLQVAVYRVAEAFPDGYFRLLEPYDSSSADIHGITQQSQWNAVAETLWSFIVSNQIQPTTEAKTDETGKAVFSEMKTGLYFVREVMAENADGTYIFNQFLVYLPTPQSDGSYDYDVEAKPKCTEFIPKTEYTVKKLWKDAGYQASRPKEVVVDIYNDGVLLDSQTLSAANNWSYTWTVSGEDYGKWTVAERTVSANYKVSVQQKGNVFSLVNARETKPSGPKTGDTSNPLLWILLMCFSGAVLLILGLRGRRHK